MLVVSYGLIEAAINVYVVVVDYVELFWLLRGFGQSPDS